MTGSVASSAHGIARTSVDADIVAALEARHVLPLIERLESAYHIAIDRLHRAVTERSSCNLIHLATMFKIDLFVPNERPFDGRRQHLIPASSYVDAPACSAGLQPRTQLRP